MYMLSHLTLHVRDIVFCIAMGWIIHVFLQLPQGGSAAGKLIID